MTAGRASGGPIGGYLTDTVGWRWSDESYSQGLNTDHLCRSFLGQCPPVLLTIALIWFFIPNHITTMQETKTTARVSRIDFIGAILLGCTILVVLLPLEIGGNFVPWSHPIVGCLFAASFVGLVLWILWEELYSSEPILSPRLLVKRSVLFSNAIMFCQAAAQLGVSLLSLLQRIRG